MSKYDDYFIGDAIHINKFISEGENILWQGKPAKLPFILNRSLNMAPIAILWLCLDSMFIFVTLKSVSGGLDALISALPIIIFLVIHLLPFWIWLYQTITAYGHWKNSEYAITDKRILLFNGLVGSEMKNIYYTDISEVTLRIGLIDRIFGVGDIVIHTENSESYFYSSTKRRLSHPTILDVKEPHEVFVIAQKTVMDIRSDIYYPNALRPEENRGYNTKYRP